ncbi:transposase DNA-binding-containing protein [Thiocapsa sp.]|uniref:IS4/Tn5 family transposase DNA-binding protein n=1 Tax=Thiocapsa sp. TaxID=2024551 RepID=UPI0026086AE5|nr:transposase DNA-binding-containing protein [Thiocapsa sp.]
MSALVAELADIDLGDVRLNRRARRVLQRLGEKPTLSIPSACGGWGETRAAYRLFDHAAVSAEAVLAPHIACTVERIREHPRVLCIEDTSELDYTGKNDIQGPGPLNYETRRGLYLHPTLAVTPIGWRWACSMPTLGCVSPAASPSPRTPLARSKRRKACAGSTASRG